MLKITEVTCFTARGCFFVKVDTEEGISGFGECSQMQNDAVLQLVLKVIKPAVLGMSAFDLEKIEEKAVLKHYKMSGQLLAIAFSGVEIALWDIKGKYLDQPVYNLLGGRYRETIDFYGSSMSRNLTPADEAAKLREGIRTHGFEAVKFKVGPRMGTGLPVNLDADVEKVRIIREAVGPSCRLLIDANSSYNYMQAVQFHERAKQYRIHHYEEPCPYYDIDAYVKLARTLPVMIHVGEQDWNLFTFRDFISRGACHLYAADVTKCGGISNARRAATLCRAHNIIYAPHNIGRGIGLAATLHLVASHPECEYYLEYSIEKDTARDRFLVEPFRVRDGTGPVPTGPGLGIELDEARMHAELEVHR